MNKNLLLILFFALGVANIFAQTLPYVVKNNSTNNLPIYSNLNLSTVLTTLAPGKRLVAFNQSGNFFQVYLPTDGLTSAENGWIFAGPTGMVADAANGYIQLTGTEVIFRRNYNLISNGQKDVVWIYPTSTGDYEYAATDAASTGAKFAVISQQFYSGYTRYQVDLPNNCYICTGANCLVTSDFSPQSNGWISGQYATYVAGSSCTAPFNGIISPSSPTVTAPNGINLSVSISGTTPFSYQWYRWDGAQWVVVTNSSPYSGATSQTLSINSSTGLNGIYYTCAVSNSCGSQTNIPYVQLNVSSPCTAPTNGTISPSNPTVTAPDGINLSVSASGTLPFSYQWYRLEGAQWVAITNSSPYSGATSQTLSINPTSTGMNGTNYTCAISNTCGYQNTIPSVQLNVSSSNVTASFNYSPSPVYTGTSVSFSNNSFGSPNNPNQFYWDLDDGYTSTATNPTYSYATCGAKAVTLTASYNGNPSHSTSRFLFVNANSVPSANFTVLASNNISAGQSVTFIGLFSNCATSYSWTFAGGNPYTTKTSTLQNPTIYFVNPGCYTVSFKAQNSMGWSNVYSINCYITVSPTATNNSPPPKNFVEQPGDKSAKIADPINLATGSYTYKHTDFNIPAIGSSLNFTRYYSTVSASVNSSLGYGWSHTYNFYIVNQGDTLWNVHYGDGHTSSFIPIYNGNGASFPLYKGTFETLVRFGNGAWKLTFKNQEIYSFLSDGKLANIIDRNNNQINFNYLNGHMFTVRKGGRTLTFGFDSDYRIISVTDALGRNIFYSYDTLGNLETVTDAEGGITTFSYNSDHEITKIIDARENKLLENVYDSSHHVISQSDAYNIVTTILYDTPPPGQTTVTFPGGATRKYVHDVFFRVTSETDELGKNKTYTYDADNNLTNLIDEKGNTISFSYDSIGNATEIIKPLSSTSKITYNSKNDPETILNALNKTVQYSYDPSGNLISITNALNKATTVSIDNLGQVKGITDALNNSTALTRNSFGDVITAVNPVGSSTFTYDTVGRVISTKDANNHTTLFSYDNNDNIKTVTDALGQTINYTYDKNNNLVEIKDKKGLKKYFVYDNKDRLSSIQDPMTGKTTFIYDTRDNLKTTIDPAGNSTTYTYDGKNRRQTSVNALGTTKYTYDEVGNLLTLVDATSNTTNYTYDSLNRVTDITDDLGNATHYTYDALGQLVEVKDALNQTTKYAYDAIGTLTDVQDAAGNISSFTYDENGNRLTIKDPNGHVSTFTYDAMNRVKSMKDASGNIKSNTYDPKGNLLTEAEANGVNTTHTYDDIDRLIQSAYSTGENNYYTYDLNDNLINTKNTGGTTAFVYDDNNRVSEMTDPFGSKVAYGYNPAGLKTSVTYPGNRTVNYFYNGINVLDKVTDWMNHTTKYSYDAAGRLTGMIYPNGTKANYAYDKASRLTKIENLFVNDSIINRSIFALDAIGNRIQEQRKAPAAQITAQSLSYSYEPDDRLLTSTGATYTNDASGNRLSETGSNPTAFKWTADNLLASYTRAGQQVTMQYDPLGNRTKRTQGSGEKRYLIDLTQELSQILQEQNANGKLTATYIYGLGLIARIDSANNMQYYHYDAQGNTVALSDSTGKLTDTYSYAPFGELLKHSGNSDQPFLFSGKYGIMDEGSNLYFIRARYYDANNGRFISKDPLLGFTSDPQTLNRFVYGLNNPVSFSDINGLFSGKDDQTNLNRAGIELLDYTNIILDYSQEENKFIGFYNGDFKIWSMKFYGNQHVTSSLVSTQKAIFNSIADGLKLLEYTLKVNENIKSIQREQSGEISKAERDLEIFIEWYPEIAGGFGSIFGSGGRVAAELVAKGSLGVGKEIGNWFVTTPQGDKFTNWLSRKLY